MADGNCLGCDPNLFFPQKGEPPATAIQVCRGCDVKTECLQYATDHHERGVWGGTTFRQRIDIRLGRPISQPGPGRPTKPKPAPPAEFVEAQRFDAELADAFRHSTARYDREVATVLRLAHNRMDNLGYPPAS